MSHGFVVKSPELFTKLLLELLKNDSFSLGLPDRLFIKLLLSLSTKLVQLVPSIATAPSPLTCMAPALHL